MNRTILIAVVALLPASAVMAAPTPDDGLAQLLASSESRPGAVQSIVASGRSKLGELLYWTYVAPPGVNTGGLYIGLADAFGELRAEEAIPFLIANISAQRGPLNWPDVFAKSPEVTERMLPFAAALVQIGPKASEALLERFWDLPSLDREAAIFTLGRIAAEKKDPTRELEALHYIDLALKSEEETLRRAIARIEARTQKVR